MQDADSAEGSQSTTRLDMPKKPLQLGQVASIPASPEEAVLDRVPNPHPDTDYVARFTFPEFTSICPVTGQPDFATLVIDYVPRGFLVESKSLKLYLSSFRNHGAFHEDCTVAIGKKLVTADETGSFKMDLPEDTYVAEVFAPGYQVDKENVTVSASKPNNWAAALQPESALVKKAVVDVFFDKKIRTINPIICSVITSPLGMIRNGSPIPPP